jgi:hypothetical protein
VTLAVAAALLTLSAPPLATTQEQIATPGQVLVEIRSYNLKTGTRDEFHELFVRVTLPMLQRRKVDVVAYGPSVHDRDSYFLMRAFSSLDARQPSEDAFYSSRNGSVGPVQPFSMRLRAIRPSSSASTTPPSEVFGGSCTPTAHHLISKHLFA